jgi:hypothetical protein
MILRYNDKVYDAAPGGILVPILEEVRGNIFHS